MKKHFIAMILGSMLVSPMAVAEGSYGGLSYGQVYSDDIHTGNLGIVLGGIAENGFGFEFFYSFPVIKYEFNSGNIYDSAEMDTMALFAVYQTPGDTYFKAKAGYGSVNLTLDYGDDGNSTDTTKGFSYGIAGGMAIGDGAIELTYFWFPDFDEFDGESVDNDAEMVNFTYLETF